MTTLEHTAKQARRRLWYNRWLSALGWTLTWSAGLFVLAIIIDRGWIVSEEPGPFNGLQLSSLVRLDSCSIMRVTGNSRALNSARSRRSAR